MAMVVAGSFVATMVLYELLVRRIAPVRTLLGVKSDSKTSPPTTLARR
jgi:hypothetical protein